MRGVLTITAGLLISSCTQIATYTEHTLFGGYVDLKVDKENHCKAKYISEIDFEKKVDYGYLRVFDICRQMGFEYFELVAIEKQREAAVNQFNKTIVYTPIIEIAGYKESADGRRSIKSSAETIKARHKLDVPVF